MTGAEFDLIRKYPYSYSTVLEYSYRRMRTVGAGTIVMKSGQHTQHTYAGLASPTEFRGNATSPNQIAVRCKSYVVYATV